MKNFKRIKVIDEKHFIKLIHYIHHNPVEAGLAGNPKEWKFSSYPSFFSNNPSAVRREEIIALFGDIKNVIYCHQSPP